MLILVIITGLIVTNTNTKNVELWSEEWMNELDKNIEPEHQNKGQTCISNIPKWYNFGASFWDVNPWKEELMRQDNCTVNLIDSSPWKAFGKGPLAFVGDSTLGYALRSFLTNSSGPHIGPIFSTVKTSQRTGTEHYVFKHPSLSYSIDVYWFGYFTFESITLGWDNIVSYNPSSIFVSSGLHDPHIVYKRKYAKDVLSSSEMVFSTLNKWVPQFISTVTNKTNPRVVWMETIAPGCDGLRWYSKKRSKLACYMFHRIHGYLRSVLVPRLKESDNVVVVPTRHLSTWKYCYPGDGIHLPQYCNQIVIAHLLLSVKLIDGFQYETTSTSDPNIIPTSHETKIKFAISPSHILRLTMPIVCIIVANYMDIQYALVLLVITMAVDGVMPRILITGELVY